MTDHTTEAETLEVQAPKKKTVRKRVTAKTAAAPKEASVAPVPVETPEPAKKRSSTARKPKAKAADASQVELPLTEVAPSPAKPKRAVVRRSKKVDETPAEAVAPAVPAPPVIESRAPEPRPEPITPAAPQVAAQAVAPGSDSRPPQQQGQPRDRQDPRQDPRGRRDRRGRGRDRFRNRHGDRDDRSYGQHGQQGQPAHAYGTEGANEWEPRSGSDYAPGTEAASSQPQDPSVPAAPPRPPEYGEGIVEVSGKGFGFIRDPSRGYTQSPQDIFVTPEVCRRYGLRDGQWIRGEIRRGNRGYQLFKLTELDGEDPEKCLELPMFDELTVINPIERIRLETDPERYTTRIIDMMSPIGKGQRGLIVAPPRTGKTTRLEHIAGAVARNHPEMKLILLLVDERPEEVTELRRNCPTAELMASSNDSDVKSHCRIAQLAIERAKRLCEMGKDVFILLDSLTRVGRAFNNATTGSGRTLSGGMDARAMEIPRRLFAAARNTEEAGSLTIIATALIETGSKMDELIFQEFKGTGNMELVLSRQIADMRVYPAVDIFLSGTRREELLIPADELHKISVIRRGLSGHKPMEAIERLLSFVKKFPTNEQMLRSIPG